MVVSGENLETKDVEAFSLRCKAILARGIASVAGTGWMVCSLWASQLLAGAQSPARGPCNLRAQLPEATAAFLPSRPTAETGDRRRQPLHGISGFLTSLRSPHPHRTSLQFTPSSQHSG